MNDKDIERVQQEVRTPNYAKIHKKQKQSEELEEQKKLGYEVGRLQVKHDNHLYDQQIEMIKEELKEFINERGK